MAHPGPRPLQQSLTLNLEHGRQGGDEHRKPFTNHYTTVGFYYLDNPEGDGPPFPPFKDRVPTLIPLPTSAEMIARRNVPNFRRNARRCVGYKNKMSPYKALHGVKLCHKLRWE